MILKETLRKLVKKQKQEYKVKENNITRELLNKIDLNVPHAIIISGIRRCGKSTLLKQITKQIKKYNYFNFEAPEIINFKLEDFEKLDNIFIEENGECEYYLFDEIQNIPNWEIYIRKLLDSKKKCLITGSNASLLSKELGTKLTGRHLTYELLPFSYKEMLKILKKKASPESFQTYFTEGGFPEFIKYKKPEILQQLFRDIINRDVIVRHKLKDTRSVKQLAIFLLTNAGKKYSYNKLTKHLNLGSSNTTISYIGFFEDSYLFFTVPKFDYSYKKQIINPKKIYSIDVGLANVNSASFSDDKGRILETLVFLAIRKQHKNIFYFQENKECDFVIKEKNKIIKAIQVCYKLNEDNKIREITGLKEAMKKFKLEKGTIVTFDQEDKIDNIQIIPIYKWLLKNQ